MTALQFLFYTLYQAVHWHVSDSFAVYKAQLVITGLLACVVVTIHEGIAIVQHHPVEVPPKVLLFGAGIAMYALQYRVFERHNRWKRYASHFQRYSKARLWTGRLLVLAFILLIGGGLVFTIAAYRQTFGITG